MPYPASPFNSDVDLGLFLRHDDDASSEIRIENEAYMRGVERWLCTSPNISSYRVNTLKCTREDVADLMKEEFETRCKSLRRDDLEEVITVENLECVDLEVSKNEVIVDVHCGAAVLRGAHIYAPGIMGMLSGIKKNDKVSIYADLSDGCKKGLQKLYECDKKLFIGNGIAKMVRYELFGENLNPGGVAVEVTDTVSGCPSSDDNFLPKGFALLQNLPSIICVHVLNPRPHDVVLDMCASPGNKTTHIAALMQNKGILIAIDKTKNKVDQLKRKCEEFGAKVTSLQANSTKLFDNQITKPEYNPEQSYFPAGYFDKILLDAPCSALGKRPQLSNRTSEKVLKSYVPLQRKLFANAVRLLKPNGVLVYSTCTITVAENEGMVSWVLKTFDCLQLEKAEPYLGGHGLKGGGLSALDVRLVQRFGPNQKIDSVGFFIAKFVKNK